HPVGLVAVRRPHLLAVQDVVVTVVHRTRLQAGEVRAGARLGISLAPPDLAANDPRQVLALLLLVAGLEQQWSDHLEPEADERRGRPLSPPLPRAAPVPPPPEPARPA